LVTKILKKEKRKFKKKGKIFFKKKGKKLKKKFIYKYIKLKIIKQEHESGWQVIIYNNHTQWK